MSERTELAEHVTGLGVAGLAMMGTQAAPLVSVAVLAAWGIDRFNACRLRKQRKTVDAVIKQIEKANPDHRAVRPALQLLKENRHKVAISPTILADAHKRGNFPDTLYDIVFGGVAVPKDDGVEGLLRMMLTTAWQDLRQEDDFHKVFVQESLTALEKDIANNFARIEAQLDRVEETGRDTNERVKSLEGEMQALRQALQADRDKLSPFAQTLVENEAFIVALAFRYAAGSASDFETALRGLERAVEVAAEAQQRDALPSNLDDAVDHVMQQVSALNAEGRIDDAATLIAEEEARAEAGLLRLWDRGIAQAILTRDVGAAVRYELKKLPVEVPEPDAQFDALRKVRRIWYERGRDKGLNFDLEVAIHLAQASVDRASGPDQRGAGLNDLGIALQTLGARDSGTARLEEAVVAYRAALQELTRDRVPLDWAMTQNNLGNALRILGERDSGTARLEQAVVAYRAALEVHTRDRVPLNWAGTQNNLGAALHTLGARESGTARLGEAVVAFRAALEEWTRDRVPLNWASAQNNLGNALKNLGARERGTARLEEAVVAYRAALEVRTRDRVPLDWAATQNNLGAALRNLGERESGTARLEEADAAFRAALEEWTRDRVPLDWASTQFNLSSVELAFFDKTKDTAHLDRAEGYVHAAREVFEEGGASHYLGMTNDQLTEIAALRTDPGD